MNASRFRRFGIPGAALLCLLFGSAAGAATKSLICHKPGTADQAIIYVASAKLPGHYGHGDYPVATEICDGRDSDCDRPIVIDNGVDCSDGVACTVDSCAGVLGCAHEPDDALCDDADPGTADSCDANSGCVHTLLCGNGSLDLVAGEECDDGNTADGDGCSASCTIEHYCGDRIIDVDAGEECDDGNNTDGDGCSSACLREGRPVCEHDLCYSGNPFNEFFVEGPTPPDYEYTSANSVHGWLELAAPLAPGLVQAFVTPISFTLTDGLNTFTEANSSGTSFLFSTDSAGEIIEWGIGVTIVAPIPAGGTQKGLNTSNFFNSFLGLPFVMDVGQNVLCGPDSTSDGCAFLGDPFYSQSGGVRDAPGVWTSAP